MVDLVSPARECAGLAPKGVVLTISSLLPSVAEREDGFFSTALAAADPEIAAAIDGERQRQQSQIELIASENIV
jgi:hypothetical protein